MCFPHVVYGLQNLSFQNLSSLSGLRTKDLVLLATCPVLRALNLQECSSWPKLCRNSGSSGSGNVGEHDQSWPLCRQNFTPVQLNFFKKTAVASGPKFLKAQIVSTTCHSKQIPVLSQDEDDNRTERTLPCPSQAATFPS